jgi:PKD repeat protein
VKFLLITVLAALALALPGQAHADYGTSVLSTHPEAYWPLDETGTSVFDMTGNRHHGSYAAACCGVVSFLGADGMPIGTGTAMHIHGNVSVYTGQDPGGKITVDGLAAPSGTSAFSVSAWVKWDGYASTCVNPTLCSDLTEGIVGNLAWAGATGGWDLQLDGKTADKGDGLLRFVRGETTLVGPALPLGQWTMVTASYDGSTSKLYFNGALVASQADVTSLGGGYQRTIFIGAQDYNRNFSGYWGSFNGSIDEVAYWNRALSAADVQGLYTGKDVNQKPIVYFVPGIGGSEIAAGNLVLWPDAIFISGFPGLGGLSFVPELVDLLAVHEDGVTPAHSTHATRVQDSVMSEDEYGTFLDKMRELRAAGGISKFVPWPYDWRIGVRTVAVDLAHDLEGQCGTGRVWVVGHSTGGHVIKAALHFMREDGVDPEQCFGGGGVVFLATPHLGAPKAIGAEINPDIFFGIVSDVKSLALATIADERKLGSILHNWLTPYELMPVQGNSHVPDGARPAWFDDLHDGLGDYNVNDDALSATLPLAAHTSYVFDSDYARTIGDLPVYNVFGVGHATPESYAPGECNTDPNGGRTYVNQIDNVHESAVTWGDKTVPAWSSAWPGGGLPTAAQYAVASPSHMDVPENDAVFVLLERIFGATNPGVYPEVPGLLHGDAALERSTGAVGPGYSDEICSPVAVVAHYDGGSIGVDAGGGIVQDGSDGLVEPTVHLHDGYHGATLFIPDHGGPAPVYRFTAIGDGRVVVHHTDPDHSQHDFVFDVHTGDKAELSKGAQEWELAIDRAGDGTVDDRMSGNSLDLVMSAGGGFGGGGLGGFGEGGGIGLDATGLSADGDVNLDFEWEIVNDDGDDTTDDEGELEAAGAHATFSPADGPRTIRIRVTVTNHRGQTASATKTIEVPNAPPKVDAGPDLSTPWAAPVTLHGSADDASAADRAAGLHPHWQFGDGTEADGEEATHTYDVPGTYTATLKATDKDGATSSDAVVVTVEKRAARIDWEGTTTNAYGFDRLSAVVVDAATSARVNVPVVYTVDGKNPALLPLEPGAHTVVATLGSNPLYTAATLATTIHVTSTSGTTAFAGVTAGGAKVAGAIWSNGTAQKGPVVWKSPDGSLVQADAFGAYGQHGSVSWAAGTGRDGARLVFHFDESTQVVEAWRNGARLAGSGRVATGRVFVR